MLVWGKLIQKLRQKGVYEESFSRHAAWIGGKLIQLMHTIMVPEQVKTMKIQAGVQVSRPGELKRHLQLWKTLFYCLACNDDMMLGASLEQRLSSSLLKTSCSNSRGGEGALEISFYLLWVATCDRVYDVGGLYSNFIHFILMLLEDVKEFVVDTLYQAMWDTAYWGFLGVRTTIGTDTPYLLDGYDVLSSLLSESLSKEAECYTRSPARTTYSLKYLAKIDVGSETRPPMLERGSYVSWASRFMRYIDRKNDIRKILKRSIKVGLYKFNSIPATAATNEMIETEDDLAGDDLKQYEADIEAMNLILLSIPNDIYNYVDACENAKDMWDGVK
ncbi:hypothetical protein Tco_0123693 [Tanacetum coccineum]